MLKYKIVDIHLSEASTVRRGVPVWELPVLRALHPKANITEVEDKLVKRDPPEAGDEFMRLANRYHTGKPEDGSPEEVSIVARVYGAFGVGNAALAAAIKEATVEDPAEDAEDLIGDVAVSSVGG